MTNQTTKRKRDEGVPCASTCMHFIDECDCAKACWEADIADRECACETRFNEDGPVTPPTDDERTLVFAEMHSNARDYIDQYGGEDWSFDDVLWYVVGDSEVHEAWLLNKQQRLSFALAAFAIEVRRHNTLFVNLSAYDAREACVAATAEQRRWCECITCQCRRIPHLQPQLRALRVALPKAFQLARDLLGRERDLQQMDDWAHDFQALAVDEKLVRDDTDDDVILGPILAAVAVGEVLPEFDGALRRVLRKRYRQCEE